MEAGMQASSSCQLLYYDTFRKKDHLCQGYYGIDR